MFPSPLAGRSFACILNFKETNFLLETTQEKEADMVVVTCPNCYLAEVLRRFRKIGNSDY
jgi:heterodisulfide reductase subunit B